jgi:hypothetical protein
VASQDDVRRIALGLPDMVEAQDRFAFSVRNFKKFFTEDHYNGFPAVLVRLAAIGVRELEELINDASHTMAPKALVTQFDEETGS